MESQEHHNDKLGLDVNALYREVCTNIRTADEISFKLLGLVPFASGAGIIGISTIDKASLIPGVRLLVAFFAVTITFAIFFDVFRIWIELRSMLLVYRLLHYYDGIPNVELNIKDREKQLFKSTFRVFQNSGKALEELKIGINKYLSEYRKKAF